MSIKVKKNPKAYNEFTLTIKCTEGKLLTLLNAVQAYAAARSVLAQELFPELKQAMKEAGISV